jgi:hypothetical protein
MRHRITRTSEDPYGPYRRHRRQLTLNVVGLTFNLKKNLPLSL